MSNLFDRTPDHNGGADGEALKQDALNVLEATRDVFILRGRHALLAAALQRGTATADDVRAIVSLPPGVGPKLFGSVPGPLATARIIRSVGSRKTCRRQGHARPVTVWELVDRPAALAWLAHHPLSETV